MDPNGCFPTEVGLTFTEDGDAIRISKASGHVIPWPDPPKYLTLEEAGCRMPWSKIGRIG